MKLLAIAFSFLMPILPVQADEVDNRPVLILRLVMPGQQPDATLTIREDSIEQCWKDAGEFVKRGVPAFTGGTGIAASCYMPTLPETQITYKPEYDKNSPAINLWFSQAEVTPLGRQRLHFQGCCLNSERFKTKFKVADDGSDEWYYMDRGGKWQPIPADIIHDEGIKIPQGHENDPGAQDEFKQLRAEGVLFLIGGAGIFRPSCFWPPESGQ